MFVLSPLQAEGFPLRKADQLGPDVCLATDFRPKGEDMVLNVKGGPVSVSTTPASLSTKTKTYYYAGFSNDTIHSCGLNGKFSNNKAEKAKLNFYLVLINSVRVIFTKAVAFNTILTIRALIF
ncbi:hypothetical protein GOODEAATRI_026999 [Goodea atripinnis]|uniref:Uncharacterized protein n=1 Tax=Goodea atripinnis TaxID=208336 RepID=A0ABV0ML65_9TELE